jgi:peptidoglycan/xylan/chitin deacetylase (PgdA/CDA1 family)
MPWKKDYTISDEIALADNEISWPENRQCCVNIVVDLNPSSSRDGTTKEDLSSPTFHFGMHEGLSQVLKLFRELNVRATFAVPALIAELFPDRIREIAAANHEIAPNGLIGEDVGSLDRNTEQQRIGHATEVIEKISGSRPLGWYALPRGTDSFATGSVSSNTVDLLIEQGYRYLGNGLADDAPHYWVTDFEARRTLLALPYYYHFDDRFFLMFPDEGTGLERPDVLFRNWQGEFAAQYRRGRYFTLTISPGRSGWGHRFSNLEVFLRHAFAFPSIWNATGMEVASHWAQIHPPHTHLRLAPSIWQDYEGSLS